MRDGNGFMGRDIEGKDVGGTVRTLSPIPSTFPLLYVDLINRFNSRIIMCD